MRTMLMSGLVAAVLCCPVSAQTLSQSEGDLRCIAVLSAASAGLEGEKQQQMAAAVMYFFGRLEGAAPNIDLKTELRRIIPTLTLDQLRAESQRCGTILIEKGSKLQEIGEELSTGQ